MRGQVGVQRHQCPLCPKSFQSPNDLERHLKKIHGTTGETVKKHSQPSDVKLATAKIEGALSGETVALSVPMDKEELLDLEEFVKHYPKQVKTPAEALKY